MTLPIGIKRRSSFTLLELILVTTILAVLAAVTVPGFRRTYARLELTDAVQDLTSLMRYAQGRALAKGRTVRLVFEDGFRQYRLLQDEDGDDRPILGRLGRVRRLPDGVALESAADQIRFFPGGTMDRTEITVCRGKEAVPAPSRHGAGRQECRIISTMAQRGRVQILNGRGEG